MIAIKIENLCKYYEEKKAVDNLNLSIEQGELFGLLGINGAGKTTTIKMITGIIKPTSGKIEIMGENLFANLQKMKEIINISPQETSIAQNLTVRENIMFMEDIYNKKHDNEWIEKLGLQEVIDQKAKTLSGGWQRRLSIALALVTDPQILFLDEPSLGLDVIARRELWDIIKQLKKSVTIILTTHYLEEITALADRVGIMVKGKMADIGTIEEILNKNQCQNLEDAFVKVSREVIK